MYDIAVIAGVIVSIFFTELTALSAGVVVPGYLALCLNSPLRILYTLLLALASMGLCRMLSAHMILFGQRRFAVMIVSAFLIDLLFRKLGVVPAGFQAVGVVIPGIIARLMDRQGVASTLLSLAVTTAATALIIEACLSLGL